MSSVTIFDIMLPAFLECLVLVGIHSYLGLHVIKRKVIFVDLALAQVAALGTTVGFLFGLHPASPGAYIFSLGFTFVAAAIFAITRVRDERIPQEAVIGLFYALAAAMAILVVWRAPHGAEHIKEILTGSILWVKWSTIAIAAVVYSTVGIFHYIFREKFWTISNMGCDAGMSGINVRLWDFLFYLSFGVVISISVHTAGVLLVFVFLVVPAIAAVLLTDRLPMQMAIGWGMGTMVSAVGLVVAYNADLSPGPSVVATYGVVLLLVALAHYVFTSRKRSRALLRVLLGSSVAATVVAAFYLAGSLMTGSALAQDWSQRHTEAQDMHAHSHAPAQLSKAELLAQRLAELDPDAVKAELAQWDQSKIESLHKLKQHCQDEMLALLISARLAELGDNHSGRRLVETLLSDETPLWVRSQAYSAIEELAGSCWGFNPEEDAGHNAKASERIHQWAKQRGWL